MEQLSRISIKNIRRFSDDVLIEIGEGATIFHAPNGTGKTSIFEAIELALTGSVKRVEADLSLLIRDQSDEAKVRLDFKSGKYCEVLLSHGSEPLMRGDHKSLFEGTPFDNVPYLLRLTHLLSQRADGWFVQSQSNTAGAQLDYLSIGREAVQANKAMTSAKRAATGLKDSVQRELDVAKENLSKWLDLLTSRESHINLDPNRPLVPLSEMFLPIKAVLERYSDDKFIFTNNLQLVKSQKSEALALLERNKNELFQTQLALGNIQPVVEEFVKQKFLIGEERKTNIKLSEIKKEAESLLNRIKLKLSGDINELELLKLKYEGELSRREKLQRIFLLSSNLNDILEQIDIAKSVIRLEEEKHESAKREYRSALQIHNEHQVYFTRGVGLAAKNTLLLSQQEAIEQWRGFERNLLVLTQELRPELSLSVNKDQDLAKELAKQRDDIHLALNEAQRNFDAINLTTDSIRSAVGIIASQYPAQRGDCPVCTQVYEPSELHRKMEMALNAIDPALQNAAARLEEIKIKLNKTLKSLNSATSKYAKSSGLLKNLNENIFALQSSLDTLVNNTFPGVNSPDDAHTIWQQEFDVYQSDVAKLADERGKAAPEPSTEVLAVLKGYADNTAQSFEGAKKRVKSLEHELYKTVDESDEEIKEVGLEEFEEISSQIAVTFTEIERINALIEKTRKDVIYLQNQLEDAANNLSFSDKKLLGLNATLNQYKFQWNALGLEAEPSEESLLDNTKSSNGKINEIEQLVSSLNELDNELVRWYTYEDSINVQNTIDSIRGAFEESSYTLELSNQVSDLIKRFELISQKAEALSSFSGFLSEELESVHELIRSINPVWNKLLKRIVVDPRFSETVLSSYSYYKKQHADVSVQLHGKDSRASYIASEAQITDLQLTFLLALAQNYKWMPWRALLLDDPTQHHDLVHASAVFDLLRDYIAEKNFQVMLATHDSVQARFFMRKLENDGIKAQICYLEATAQGVKATSR